VQYYVSNHIGPALVDVAGGLISLVALALFLKVWQPRDNWRFADEVEPPPDAEKVEPRTYTTGQILYAWVPWLLLSALVFLAGVPTVSSAVDEITAAVIPVDRLHEKIVRVPPVVAEPHTEKSEFRFNWLSTTGTAIFIASILSAAWLRVSPARFVHIFARTVYRMRWPLFTIACMLALAYVTRYSGMDATLGLAFTKTGVLYPFFAALLGWLGVALTGSDTSSNALFGSLQTITAGQLVEQKVLPLELEQARVLLATANSTGGVMGKMIDAQSIVVAAVATGQHNQEGAILRFVFWHSFVLAFLMGLLVLAQAYVLSWMIP
jgi:lactate permease